MILAIDPGTTESAYVLYDAGRLVEFGKVQNLDLLLRLKMEESASRASCLAIEMIQHYGKDMNAGASTFETCVWIGRFIEAWGQPCEYVYRREVKLHLCGSCRAKDPDVRTAIIDRYPRDGGGKCPQIGTKAKPGPLHGVSGDVWAALGVAITYVETKRKESGTPQLLLRGSTT